MVDLTMLGLFIGAGYYLCKHCEQRAVSKMRYTINREAEELANRMLAKDSFLKYHKGK